MYKTDFVHYKREKCPPELKAARQGELYVFLAFKISSTMPYFTDSSAVMK